MIAKTEQDIEGLKKVGKVVAIIRDELKNMAKPGVRTIDLDLRAAELFEQYGAVSAPKVTYDFPGYTCISINEEVAHGIPGERVIQEGDLVNVDVSGSLDGYFADTGVSFVVGKGDPRLTALCEASIQAFDAAAKKIKAGSKRSNAGKASHNTARKLGFTVITNLTGHGIGKSLHDEPEYILSYYDPTDNDLWKEGSVIAFEPFVSTKAEEVYEGSDGWTLKTDDGSYVAQYEHTLIITKGEPIILTK
ncbi:MULTISPECIES: type I methionyl aminopeptidase [Paenibacillus]|uniref:type I methionyl aminopeptidase n=1 Tax=Paenibacillus TaxID=44249 RepID=UPI0003683D31|nr:MULTISPECIES: type I methionyl aminopeptidase [Paenibacillus]